jgi:ketosteroid isomerase-like protein
LLTQTNFKERMNYQQAAPGGVKALLDMECYLATCGLEQESIFAQDIVSFDIVRPLQHVGAETKLKNWADVFTAYQSPLGYEIRDLTITVGDEVAFGHSLNRISGTLKSGNRIDYWVRWTGCFRKIDGNWLIVHDQVSVPIDVISGRALLNLKP